MSGRRKGRSELGERRVTPAASLRGTTGEAERLAAAAAADVARYVAGITVQLETMARSARLDLLAYFLGMARLESETLARAAESPEPGARDNAAKGDGEPDVDEDAASYDPGPPKG